MDFLSGLKNETVATMINRNRESVAETKTVLIYETRNGWAGSVAGFQTALRDATLSMNRLPANAGVSIVTSPGRMNGYVNVNAVITYSRQETDEEVRARLTSKIDEEMLKTIDPKILDAIKLLLRPI